MVPHPRSLSASPLWKAGAMVCSLFRSGAFHGNGPAARATPGRSDTNIALRVSQHTIRTTPHHTLTLSIALRTPSTSTLA
jgi:hypothetical protein